MGPGDRETTDGRCQVLWEQTVDLDAGRPWGPEKSEFGVPGGGTGLRKRVRERLGELEIAQARRRGDSLPRQEPGMNAAAPERGTAGGQDCSACPPTDDLLITQSKGGFAKDGKVLK